MYSMLNEIDKYIKKNGIPFNRISFSYTYLPDYINYVLLEKLRGIQDNSFIELGSSNYELAYDKNGIIYMKITSSINYNDNIVVAASDKIELDFVSTVVKESRVIEEACLYKILSNYRKKVELELSKSNLSPKNKIYVANKLLRIKKNEKYNELLKKGESIFDKVDYKTPMQLSTKKIIDYISYLNEEYQETLIEKFNSDYDDEILKIEYNEPVGIGQELCYTNIFSESNKYERTNPIISASSRIQHLESFPYIYRGYAYNNSSNKEISYVSYLYNIGDNKYILIIEPYNGSKYTKIIVLDKTDITKEEFKNNVRKYLEMNTLDYLDDESAIRTAHTTVSKFNETINYLLLGVTNRELNPILKKKILKIKSGE